MTELEILYRAAYGMYEVGDYEKGAELFTKLCLNDPFDIRFWKGLASCRQMLKECKAALHAWGVVALLGNHPPAAHFHAAECYLSMGDVEEAKKALRLAKLHLDRKDNLFKRVQILNEQVESYG